MRLRELMPELTEATAYLNGKVTKEQLVGDKPTLIHFWSISCHLCKEAMQDVNEFRIRYNNELNVVAIHMPLSEGDLNIEEIQSVAAKHNMTQPILIDSESKLSNRFDNEYVPAYYVFDKDGQLRHFQVGGGGMKMLKKRVNRVLDEMKRS